MSDQAEHMQILVLGMPRTGTQSIADALEQLGYKPIYHMREVGKNKHPRYWISALEAKYEGKGKAFGRKEFDEFLGDFAGVADFPAAIFPAELIAAYPNAKIVLNVRDEDKWFDSMMTTIWQVHTAPDAKPTPMRALAEKYHQHLWAGDFPKHGRARFREHNKFVEDIAPKERFLKYEVKEGWAPLCAFLGKEIPECDFPRNDDWLAYKIAHGIGSKEVQS